MKTILALLAVGAATLAFALPAPRPQATPTPAGDFDERVPHKDLGYPAWTPEQAVGGRGAIEGDLAVDSRAVAHVVYRDLESIHGVQYVNSDWTKRGMNGFSDALDIVDTTDHFPVNPDICVDSRNVAHAVWVERFAADGNMEEIRYRKPQSNADGHWDGSKILIAAQAHVSYENPEIVTTTDAFGVITYHLVAKKLYLSGNIWVRSIVYMSFTSPDSLPAPSEIITAAAGDDIWGPYDLVAIPSCPTLPSGAIAFTWLEHPSKKARLGILIPVSGNDWKFEPLPGKDLCPIAAGRTGKFAVYGWLDDKGRRSFRIYSHPTDSWKTEDGAIPSEVTAEGPIAMDSRDQIIIGGSAVRAGRSHGDSVWGQGPLHTCQKAVLDRYDRVHALNDESPPMTYSRWFDPNLGEQGAN